MKKLNPDINTAVMMSDVDLFKYINDKFGHLTGDMVLCDIADIFKKISNTLKVNNKVGEKKSTDEITKLDKEKYKHNEVLDKIPDSSNSVLF